MLDEALARLDADLADQTRPFEAELARLDSLPGVNRRIAEVLAVDMKPFVAIEHLALWAGMCPGNRTSAIGFAQPYPMCYTFRVLSGDGPGGADAIRTNEHQVFTSVEDPTCQKKSSL